MLPESDQGVYGMYLVHVDPSINTWLRASPIMLNMCDLALEIVVKSSISFMGGVGKNKKLVPRTWMWETCLQSNTYWGRSGRGDGLREEICTYDIGTIGIWLALCLRASASELFVISNMQRWGHEHWPKNP